MARWTRTETTVTRITYTVPAPIAYAELYRTIAAAEANYRRKHGIDSDATLFDDALTIRVSDDNVLVTFDISTDQPQATP